MEDHVGSLEVQGRFLLQATQEKSDIVWQSHKYNLKQGTLKFLLNASIDTLPTAANLRRWKKSSSDLCKLCRSRQTTNHVLNGCKVSLESGRYLWRHNCLINYCVSQVNTDKYTVYSDIPGHEAPGGGTIPPQFCVTPLLPDIVLVEKITNRIHIFELSCPGESLIDVRNIQKGNKYAHFLIDIPNCKVTAFEVSSKGYISPRNHSSIKLLHQYMKPDMKLNVLKRNLSMLSVVASHQIFISRNDPTFVIPPYLLPSN